MGKPEDTLAPEDEPGDDGVRSRRLRKTDSTNAAVLVRDADGTREIRMIDFLRDIAGDGPTFERVGAMAVGQELEVHRGAVLVFTVRRVR